MQYYLVANYSVEDIENASFEECLDYIKTLKRVGVDIETTRKYKGAYGKEEGLNPHLSKIVMIQVGDLNKQFVIDARQIDCKPLIELLSTKLCIGHNLKFEYKHFLVNYGVRLLSIYDTMLTEQVLYNGLELRNSLEELNKRYLKIRVDKSTRKEFLAIGKRPFTRRQIEYGVEDIVNPLKIMPMQLETVKDLKLTNCIKLEMQFALVLGDIETKGLHFNKDTWKEAYDKALPEYTRLKQELSEYVVQNHPDFCNRQLSLFEEGVSCGIQWTSSTQVIPFLDSLGLCPEAESKQTKEVRKTVEAKELKVVLTRDDLTGTQRWLLKTYLDFKQAEQAVTTFGLSFFKYVNPITGRLHSSYQQIINTGRISSKNPKQIGCLEISRTR